MGFGLQCLVGLIHVRFLFDLHRTRPIDIVKRKGCFIPKQKASRLLGVLKLRFVVLQGAKKLGNVGFVECHGGILAEGLLIHSDQGVNGLPIHAGQQMRKAL